MNYDIITLVLLIAAVASFLLYAICIRRDNPYPIVSLSYYTKENNGGFKSFAKDHFVGHVLPIVISLCVAGSFYSAYKAAETKTAEKYAEIENAVSSGYTLYINGAETDISHITLEDYSLSTITVNDEIREVHIAANK